MIAPFSHICVNMCVTQVAREVQLHSTLVHEGVIAMYAAWKDPTYVYMAIEWAAGVSIHHYSRVTCACKIDTGECFHTTHTPPHTPTHYNPHLTCSQGDVYAFMRKNGGSMREEVVVPLILQPFLAALDAIHLRGLIHRDIKVCGKCGGECERKSLSCRSCSPSWPPFTSWGSSIRA